MPQGQRSLFLQLLALEVEVLLIRDLCSFGRVLIVSIVLVLKLETLGDELSRLSDMTSIRSSAYRPRRPFIAPRRISCSLKVFAMKCAVADFTG